MFSATVLKWLLYTWIFNSDWKTFSQQLSSMGCEMIHRSLICAKMEEVILNIEEYVIYTMYVDILHHMVFTEMEIDM